MTDSNRPPLTFAFFPDVATFEVTSDDIAEGATMANSQVANFMGYSGENHSPQLSWRGFPSETKSFEITVDEGGAPTAGPTRRPRSPDSTFASTQSPELRSCPNSALDPRTLTSDIASTALMAS